MRRSDKRGPNPSLAPTPRGVKAEARTPVLEPWPAGAGLILAAVSGGGDSVALLRLLQDQAPARGWRLAVGHVDHGLRPGSEDDAAFVAALAAERGLPFISRRVEVQPSGRSPEEAARLARNAALRSMAAEAGASWVALGHTADDQAETVLARALMGSGPSGLAGMRPLADVFWRPLLGWRRQHLRAYLETLGQAWRKDPSNQELGPLRNRLRHRLLPLAQELVNPRSVEALCRLAALAGEEEEVWSAWCLAQAPRLIRREGPSLCLAAEHLAIMAPAQARRLLRLALEALVGGGQHLLASHIEQLRDLASGGPGRELSLPRGLWAMREQKELRLAPLGPPPDFKARLHGPGAVWLPHLGAWLAVLPSGRPAELSARPSQAWLPAKRVAWPLSIGPVPRRRRLRPLGAPGSKEAGRLLINYKVPRWWRPRSLLVSDRQGDWWLGPWLTLERARLNPDDHDLLRLCFVDRPLPPPYTTYFENTPWIGGLSRFPAMTAE